MSKNINGFTNKTLLDLTIQKELIFNGNTDLDTWSIQENPITDDFEIIRFNSDTNTQNVYLTIDATTGFITGDFTTSSIQDTDGDTKIETEKNADEDIIRFSTDGQENMIINENGRLIIGRFGGLSSITPNTDLTIYNNTNTSASMVLQTSNTGSSTSDGFFMGINSTSTVNILNYENTNMNFWTNGAQRMIIDNDGNVGIGIAPPTSTIYPLTVYDTIIGGIQLTNNTAGTTSSDGGVIFQSGTEMGIGNRENGSITLSTNGSTALTLDASQIATFNGDIRGDDDTNLEIYARGNGDGEGLSLSNEASTGTKDAEIRIEYTGGSVPEGRITFDTSGLEAMRIDSDGNVGIGTTSPSQKLEINNSSEEVLGVYNTGGGTDNSLIIIGDSIDRMKIGYKEDNIVETSITPTQILTNTLGDLLLASRGDNGSEIIFYTSSGTTATERMRIDDDGRVGIGTTPSNLLHIKGGTTEEINFRGDSDSGSYRIEIGCNDTGSSYPLLYLGSSGVNGWCEINSRFSYPMVFFTGNTERMRILSNGNIGIGTDTPGRKLEVVGDITHKKSMVIRRRTSTQSISNNTDTAIQFNISDTKFGSDITVTSNTDFTINTDGLYQVEYTLSLSANATGVRAFYISINGTTDRYAVYTIPGNSTNAIRAAGSALINLSASDIVRIYVWQNSGSSLTVAGSTILTARLTIYRVGDNY